MDLGAATRAGDGGALDHTFVSFQCAECRQLLEARSIGVCHPGGKNAIDASVLRPHWCNVDGAPAWVTAGAASASEGGSEDGRVSLRCAQPRAGRRGTTPDLPEDPARLRRWPCWRRARGGGAGADQSMRTAGPALLEPAAEALLRLLLLALP